MFDHKAVIARTIKNAIEVPDYIHACANACRYDLLYGPSFVRIPQGDVTKFTDDDLATFYDDAADESEPGDVIEETYTGKVAAALSEFLDDLPHEAWVDTDCECFMTSEPEGETDEETGKYLEPYMESTYVLDHTDIVEALFGHTIAHEFR